IFSKKGCCFLSTLSLNQGCCFLLNQVEGKAQILLLEEDLELMLFVSLRFKLLLPEDTIKFSGNTSAYVEATCQVGPTNQTDSTRPVRPSKKPILQCIYLVLSTKALIKNFRDSRRDFFISKVKSLFKDHDISIPDFNARHILRRVRSQSQQDEIIMLFIIEIILSWEVYQVFMNYVND
ncbi:hypothetical protein Tsubulata_024784, partial [Turnera subulata]